MLFLKFDLLVENVKKHSEKYWMSEALSLTMAQSWPWGTQIAVEKKTSMFELLYFWSYWNIFLKTLMFNLLYFPSYRNILSVRTLLWKEKMLYLLLTIIHFPDGIYLFKVNSGNNKIMHVIYSELAIKTLEQYQWQVDSHFKYLWKIYLYLYEKNFIYHSVFICSNGLNPLTQIYVCTTQNKVSCLIQISIKFVHKLRRRV